MRHSLIVLNCWTTFSLSTFQTFSHSNYLFHFVIAWLFTALLIIILRNALYEDKCRQQAVPRIAKLPSLDSVFAEMDWNSYLPVCPKAKKNPVHFGSEGGPAEWLKNGLSTWSPGARAWTKNFSMHLAAFHCYKQWWYIYLSTYHLFIYSLLSSTPE